jgi:hypothetical protein
MDINDPIAVLHNTPGPTREEAAPESLGNVQTVEDIVTEFSKAVVERFSPEEGTEGFMRWLEPECDALNSLFLGFDRDPPPGREHFIRSNWNTPDRCGAFVARAMGMSDTELRHTVRLAFMMLADWITDIVIANAEDEDVEGWVWQITALNEQVTYALLGIPYDVDLGAAD